MKYFCILILGFFAQAVMASPVDDRVAQFSDVLVVSPVSYQGKPIHSGLCSSLCGFLGYKVCLTMSEQTVNGDFFDVMFLGDAYELILRTNGNGVDVYKSVTCAR